MPVSVGRAWTIWLKASRPPAEAPMPTMGNCAPGVLVDSGTTCTGSGGRAGELLGGPAEPEAPFGGLGRLPADSFRATTTSSLPLGSAAVSRSDQPKASPERPPEPWHVPCSPLEPEAKIGCRIRATGSLGSSRARRPRRHTAQHHA